MRQFHDSYKSNFWQIFSIWPNCVPLAPTHSSHSLLNRQRFVEVDLCWPLHARLAHIYLPSSLPFPLTYYVLDLGITIYNAAYAKQTHSKNVSKNLSSSLHNCLHSQNLEGLLHIPRPKGQIYKTMFLHSFRAAPPPCKKASLDAYIAFASAFWSH